MGRLTTDSPISRRIVLAFLDFLQSVEPAPGVDLEGLDVARECLQQAFGIDHLSNEYNVQPGLLVDLFNPVGKQNDHSRNPTAPPLPSFTASTPSSRDPNVPESSKSEEQLGAQYIEEVSKDELLGQFLEGLDRINFFTATAGEDEDDDQLSKATRFFEDALLEMEKVGGKPLNKTNLAETFKSQGNRNMQSKLYPEAIDLYTFAIVLSDKNAIYYCNRAAAYTQTCKYAEAIVDCKKSIEIDPNYAKAYSREGLVYYAMGKYNEALLIFLKALQLDPGNVSVQENIRVAQQKLREQQQRDENRHQTTGTNHGEQQSSSSRTNPDGFSMPIDVSEIARVVMNMVPGATPSSSEGQNSQSARSGSSGYPFTSVSTSTTMPFDISQMLSGMVSGASSQQNQTGNPRAHANESSTRADSGININLQDLPQEFSDIVASMTGNFTAQNEQQNERRG